MASVSKIEKATAKSNASAPQMPKAGGCIGDWSGKIVMCKAHGRPLAQCPSYITSAASGNRAI